MSGRRLGGGKGGGLRVQPFRCSRVVIGVALYYHGYLVCQEGNMEDYCPEIQEEGLLKVGSSPELAGGGRHLKVLSQPDPCTPCPGRLSKLQLVNLGKEWLVEATRCPQHGLIPPLDFTFETRNCYTQQIWIQNTTLYTHS